MYLQREGRLKDVGCDTYIRWPHRYQIKVRGFDITWNHISCAARCFVHSKCFKVCPIVIVLYCIAQILFFSIILLLFLRDAFGYQVPITN